MITRGDLAFQELQLSIAKGHTLFFHSHGHSWSQFCVRYGVRVDLAYRHCPHPTVGNAAASPSTCAIYYLLANNRAVEVTNTLRYSVNSAARAGGTHRRAGGRGLRRTRCDRLRGFVLQSASGCGTHLYRGSRSSRSTCSKCTGGWAARFRDALCARRRGRATRRTG